MSAEALRHEIVVRAARLRDLPTLRRLDQVCFGPDAWGYLGLLFALLSPGNVSLLAEKGARVIGLVVGEPHLWRKRASISTLGVHPDFRRRGLGTRLLAACEACLKQPALRLTVRASNAPAIALYEKLGYTRTGRRPHYYAGGEDAVEMTKALRH